MGIKKKLWTWPTKYKINKFFFSIIQVKQNKKMKQAK